MSKKDNTKRNPRISTYNLNRVTAVLKARQVADLYSHHGFTMDGWAAYLKTTKAAEHAVNGLLAHEKELPFDMISDAIAMTIARVCDFGRSPKEAAQLILDARHRKALRITEPTNQTAVSGG